MGKHPHNRIGSNLAPVPDFPVCLFEYTCLIQKFALIQHEFQNVYDMGKTKINLTRCKLVDTPSSSAPPHGGQVLKNSLSFLFKNPDLSTVHWPAVATAVREMSVY